MSIDRIGKGDGAIPTASIAPSESSSAGAVKGAAPEAFKVARASTPQAMGPLDRLRSGEISLSEYLDARVEAATAHLPPGLAPEQLEFIQTSLREQLARDPVLVDLVKAATGSIPPTTE